jgi:hypothetical protein
MMKELIHALTHYREIRVLQALHGDPESPPRDTDIDFIIVKFEDIVERVIEGLNAVGIEVL